MHTIRMLFVLVLLLSCAQAMEVQYKIGGWNDITEVIYSGELSSNHFTWINLTTSEPGFSECLKVKPKDSSYTYIMIICKVKV
jgi:hypothetical protein